MAVLGLVLSMFTWIPAASAAAPTPVHEMAAQAAWVGNPADVLYGGTITGEWKVSTNDAVDPYARDTATNVVVRIVVVNARFASIPAVCKTSGATPASSISTDGTILDCNVGDVVEGTATVVQAVVRAASQTGGSITATATTTSDYAPTPSNVATAPPVPIRYSHGMDFQLSSVSQNYQGTQMDDSTGVRRQVMVVDWSLALLNGSRPGPASVNIPIRVSAATPGASLAGLRVEVAPSPLAPATTTTARGCVFVNGTSGGFITTYGRTGPAPGIPSSWAGQPDRTNFPPQDNGGSCTITGTAPNFVLHLTGLDYSLTTTPTKDSLGNQLPGDRAFIASGALNFSIPRVDVNTTFNFVATVPNWSFTDGYTGTGGAQGSVVDAPANNSETVTLYAPGGFNNYWAGTPTAGRSAWDDGLFVAQGTSLGTPLPGTATYPGGSLAGQVLPLYSQATNSMFMGYAGSLTEARVCTMKQPSTFVYDKAEFFAYDPVDGYQAMNTGRLYYTTDALNTKTEKCDGALGTATSGKWRPVAGGAVEEDRDPRYAGAKIHALPAGVTAVMVVWNPTNANDRNLSYVAVRGYGHITPNAPIGSEGWTVGAYRHVNGTYYNNGTVNGPTTPTPWSTYTQPDVAKGTNAFRDVYRVQGGQGVITKSASPLTAEPGVPITYTITGEPQSTVPSAPPTSFTITDTLPVGMVYVAGSAVPAPTNVNGRTLTWSLTAVPVNTNRTITYQAMTPADSTLAPGAALTNTATIAVPGDLRPVADRSASATVVVPNSATTVLGKQVADNTLSFYGDSSYWTLNVNSYDPAASSFTDTIDILPAKGDARGTNVDGGYTLGAVVPTPTTTKIFYTTAPRSSLSLDPRASSNGTAPGAITGNTVGWTTVRPADASTITGVRVIGGTLAPGALQSIRINFTTAPGTDCVAPAAGDNKPGQILVNSAGSIATHTAVPMYSSATATIGDCYAMDLKKYVLAKGGDASDDVAALDSDWHDADTRADFPQYIAGDTVSYRIIVTNKGTGTLTNVIVNDPIVPACSTTIPSIPAGENGFAIVNCTATAAVGTTVNVATATTTPPDGGQLTVHDPAGIVVPDPYVVEKTSVPPTGSPVAPGSEVTYTITVTEPETSAAPFLSPSFADSLSAVLDDADYLAGSETASTGSSVTYDAASKTLSWAAGLIAPGQTYTITYKVTVKNPTTGDSVLTNTVTTPPGESNCPVGSTDPRCTDTLFVPSYTVSKSVNVPATYAGDTITYTVTVANTGQVAYPATGAGAASFSDPLTDIALDGELVEGSATASAGTVDTAGGAVTWSGPLAVAPGAGSTVTVTYQVKVNDPDNGDHLLVNTVTPTGPGGACVTVGACTTETPVGSYTTVKTSAPATTIAGGTVTYTVVVTNTGQVAYNGATPATFADDLTDVLDDASYIAGSATATAGTVAVAGTTLAWTGPLDVSGVGSTATITYQVLVDNPIDGNALLVNAVTPTGPGGSCATAGACTTTTPIRSYEVTKIDNATVTLPGGEVVYTISITNTGSAPYTTEEPAQSDDDLSLILDDAVLNEASLQASSGTVGYTAPTIHWEGALPVGATVTITYTVTVNSPDSGNHSLDNTVTTPPGLGGDCLPGSGDPKCTANVLVKELRVQKSSDTSTVIAGQTVRYTVTVTNTGAVAYPATGPDAAQVNDDLTALLGNADYNDDAVISPAGGALTYPAPVLNWTGPLPIGATATITYTVTVHSEFGNTAFLINTITTPPGVGGNCTPPDPSDPVCQVVIPGNRFEVSKEVVNPSTKVPGDTVDYRITVRNTGSAPYTTGGTEGLARIADSLSGVLDDAAVTAGPTIENSANAAPIGTASITGSDLTWAGELAVEGVVVLTYSVKINNPDTGDHLLSNTVRPTAPGGLCPTAGDCTTLTPVASFTVAKTRTPASTTPGGVVTYTVRVTNTGQVPYTGAYLAGFSDDLSDVLKDADYTGPNGANGLTFTAPNLTWSGAVAVGGFVDVTYTVTVPNPVKADGDLVLINGVAPAGPGGTCVSPAACTTTTPIQQYTVVKKSDPAVGTPGGKVTYSVTVVNTGQVAYPADAPATFTDDLSGVLDDATYNGDATGGATVSGATLSWAGSLAIGQTIIVTYSVTIANPDQGDHLLINAVTPTGPGGSCAGTCTTTTPVPSYTVSKVVSSEIALPGEVVTYTITVANTGPVAYAGQALASFSDDLSKIVDDATYVAGSAAASAGTLDIAAGTISWRGPLAVAPDPEATVTVSYQFRINDPDSGDMILANTVVPTTPGGSCAPEGTCTTTTKVPGYTTAKVVSAFTAKAGDTLTYTVTVVNTGQVDYAGDYLASFADDLSRVIDDATYVAGSAQATAGTATVNGAEATWSGPLPVGGTVTVTYQFLVIDSPTGNGALVNTVAPDGPGGKCVTPADCTATTTIRSYSVDKVASTTSALEGDSVRYTITVRNTGNVAYPAEDPASLTDDLTGVLDDATMVAGSAAASAGTVDDTALPTLRWAGALAAAGQPGDTVTITYTVTVNTPDTGDKVLRNTVTPTGPGGKCAPQGVCQTDTPVASYTVHKEAAPKSVLEGGTIAYTVTVTNTGKVAYPAAGDGAASFTDDLTALLDDATYNGDAADDATPGGTIAYTAPELTWTGALPIEGTVVVTYTATINTPDAGDHLVVNAVTPTGPGGQCVENGCQTVTPVQSYMVAKVASAAWTTPGGMVTYQILVTNTGQVAYTPEAPASLMDDLSDVLSEATMVPGSMTAVIPGTSDSPEIVQDAPVLDGATLSWSGPLPAGQQVVVSYSVTVDDPDYGDHLLDNAVAPTSPGGTCDEAIGCETRTPVASYTVEKNVDRSSTIEGDKLVYTVTVTNTGQVDYEGADLASFTDDLTSILDDASYNNDGSAGVAYSEPIITWAGALAIDRQVVVTYSVTIDTPDQGDHVLTNEAIPTGPGGACALPMVQPEAAERPEPGNLCQTTTPVKSYRVAKTADKPAIYAGDTVTYTITVTNNGQVDYTEQDPASFVDDLTEVLDDAVYNNDAAASTGEGAIYAAPVLSWGGELAIGEVVTVTYSVTVKSPITGDRDALNSVVTPPGSGANCLVGSHDPTCTVDLLGPSATVTKTVAATQTVVGGIVTWTITIKNTGIVPYTDQHPMSISDDLSGVLDDATYNHDVAVSGGPRARYTAPTLTWSGPLAGGATVTLTYSVTVHNPATGDKVLRNTVVSAQEVGATCSTGSSDPACRADVQVLSSPPPLAVTGANARVQAALALLLLGLGALLVTAALRRRGSA